MSSIGIDAATVKGDWSIRAEAAYASVVTSTRKENCGDYRLVIAPRLIQAEPERNHKSDTIEYGVGVDYAFSRIVCLSMQGPADVIMNRPETHYDRKFETLFLGQPEERYHMNCQKVRQP